MKRLAIVILSLVTALTSVPPAMAFPTVAVPKIEATKAQPVQYRNYRGGYRGGYRGYRGRGYRHGGDDWAWALGGLATGAIIGGMLAQPRYYGPSYYGGGYYGQGYYDRGYYGSPYYGPPRYYGSTIYRPRYYAPYRPRYYAPRYRQVYNGGNGHVSWCYSRYRSYRAYDNTFQPYYGPRRACVSPY
ncbi:MULTISPECIES: BA14K family protein [Rhizobium]|uniref:Lectin-like protein BA14k n=1 Tax=Rhizobium leguminosarum bv. viciae TaxID=387 RepID=A0A8I2KMJ5_RHILV|nr:MULTISPECIES: BA14K family protein [Rhizobium]KAF5884300.1 BA14K family protein [Rhizobium sp. PEPV16]MBY5748708.1 BA14K family protein [Rhizobium leguminosarum]MBY5783828.1 BA14K family protein [Rhizobium leguminosarum]MBY5795030.1 BA14K family protein [Rhizobium leguminosarum]MBY5796395.1 BA14K family protein [Rhizobium leguminosarum]